MFKYQEKNEYPIGNEQYESCIFLLDISDLLMTQVDIINQSWSDKASYLTLVFRNLYPRIKENLLYLSDSAEGLSVMSLPV